MWSRNQDYDYPDVDLFNDDDERKRFVARVYLILTVMLGFVTVVVLGVSVNENVREYIYDHSWIGFIFLGGYLITYLMLVCSECTRKNFPCNVITLSIFTLFVAALSAFYSAMYELDVVIYALLATTCTTLLVTAVAKWAPCDITGCGMIFCIGFLALAVSGLIIGILSIFFHLVLLHLILACVSVVLFSMYLMFITQLIMGGRMESISPDETILAVILLFIAIWELFISFLQIFGIISDQ